MSSPPTVEMFALTHAVALRLGGAAFVTAWAGITLLFSCVPWFARRSLTERLRPYVAAGWRPVRLETGVGVRRVLLPVAHSLGSGLGRLVGVREEVGIRIRRLGRTDDVGTFRLHQLGVAALAALGASVLCAASHVQGIAVVVVALAAACAGGLWVEQTLLTASRRYQAELLRELPVVAEQLGMLMTTGYSLSAALGRLARRGSGRSGADLARVVRRIRQGIEPEQACREWAELAQVPALDQLVEVLALNRDAGDLGGLISAEARAIRREVHRTLIESIERKSQMVWIPVTVATLVPGVIFIAIPFTAALSAFTGS